MAKLFTQQEYEVRRGYMECIDGMHEPPYDSDYDQMTVNVGEMLRLYATIDYLMERPRLPLGEWEDQLDQARSLEIIKARRRRRGWCMLCGASRQNPGKGCYEVPVGLSAGTMTWMMHSWPEETPDVFRE